MIRTINYYFIITILVIVHSSSFCDRQLVHTETGRVNSLVSVWKAKPQHPELQAAADDTLLSLE